MPNKIKNRNRLHLILAVREMTKGKGPTEIVESYLRRAGNKLDEAEAHLKDLALFRKHFCLSGVYRVFDKIHFLAT